MNLFDPSEDKAGSRATNVPPKDASENTKRHTLSEKDGIDRLDRAVVNRHSGESFSSCMASSMLEHCSKDTTKKSSPGQVVGSSLFQLDDDAIWDSDMNNDFCEISQSMSKFASIQIGNTGIPNDGAPVVPRRSSDPYLYRSNDVEVPQRDVNTDGVLHGTVVQKQWSDERTQDFRISGLRNTKTGFEGMTLQCEIPTDDGVESDLTRTDTEDGSSEGGKSSDIERPDEAPPASNSRNEQQNSPRMRVRRCGNQGKRNMDNQTTPTSPLQCQRRTMPYDETFKIDFSGSPSTARLSTGTGGTRMLGSRGRGSSPGRYRSYRGERRWSVTSGTREDSLDEMLKTPRRRNPDEDHPKTIEMLHSQSKVTIPVTKVKAIDDGDSSENPFQSPAAIIAYSNDATDHRIPNTSRATPSPKDVSNRLRDKIHTLECPPPL